MFIDFIKKNSAIVFFSFAIFAMILPFSVLDVTNILWLVSGSSDMSTHYLGWAFFYQDDWRWPIGLNPNYGLEYHSSIIFSDSIPIVSFLFKLFSHFLPKIFQYSGLWLLFCILLQLHFSIKLLKIFQSNLLFTYLGAVFFVFSPPLLWRLHGHLSLFAHWIILAAIYFYFNTTNNRYQSLLKWGALLSFAILTHTYLWAMISVIWLADVSRRNRSGMLSINNRKFEIFSIAVLMLCVLWVAGFFPLRSSYLSGGYGIHRFNLLSLINPQGVIAQADTWSYLLPILPQGEGDYEGFSYLGLGGVLLLIFSSPYFVKYIKILIAGNYQPLLWAVLLLLLFSISNVVGFGDHSIKFWIPEWLIKIANIMRASGRFFWPIFYLLLLSFLFIIKNEYKTWQGILIISIAAIFQVVDTHAGWGSFRYKFAPHASTWNTSLSRPDIKVLASNYKKIRSLPTYNAVKDWDLRSNLALELGLPTDSVYLARYDDSILRKRNKLTEEKLFSRANLDVDSLYFLNEYFLKKINLIKTKNDAIFCFDKNIYIYAPDYFFKTHALSLSSPSPSKSDCIELIVK